jgi:hypothetical protein
MSVDPALIPLSGYLNRLPGVAVLAGRVDASSGLWWVKLHIN